jgi:UDP-N-acetylmuramoyl-tripeptide--D-alanyl-D-alanine ligase
VSGLLALAGFVVFAWRRLLTYLHLFQQEEYDSRRFLVWLVRNRGWDQRLSFALLVVWLIQVLRPHQTIPDWAFGGLAGAACLAVAAFERNPKTNAKKALVMTARATRICWVAQALLALLGVAVAVATGPVVLWIAVVQLVPLALVGANLLLAPLEAQTQRRYWREAQAVLRRIDPMVIAITGSYGKTSVKHILGHVLVTAAPTLITPGSVNTAMGIARVVRERLQPHHRYFIVEMGAYGPGSIRRLCALTPPRMGIVTAIGMAHYERFKTLETVAEAKFELAEAVVANGGKTIAAADALEFAAPRRFHEAHPGALLLVGSQEDSPCGASITIDAMRQDIDGVAVTVTWQGRKYELRAPLFGLQQGRNIALAFAAACTLGLAPEDVVASLRSTPQIAHRLEVKREANGATLIDDAYNSNPVGFAAALEVLDVLRSPGGRRILVTPGMVELGAAHDEEHRRIGRLAATHVDVLVAVAPHHVAPLAQSFAEAAPAAEIVSCPGFAEAQAWMARNVATGDVVLLENDLPDLLERQLRL